MAVQDFYIFKSSQREIYMTQLYLRMKEEAIDAI